MIQDELQTETEMRRFLLGEMPDGERGAFEERFVADEDFFEQICVVEDELIESYIRQTLSAATREKFERVFLTTNRRRERVAFARTMLDKLPEYKEIAVAKKIEATAVKGASVWASIIGFFKTPTLAFGAAFAILFAVFGGWFLLRNSNPPEIVQQIKPTPTISVTEPNPSQTPEANQNSTLNSNLKTPEKIEPNRNDSTEKTPNKNSDAPRKDSNLQKKETSAPNPIFALVAGTVRGEGKTRELSLSKNANNIRLQLNLETVDYKIYRAEIVTADGETVAQSGNLKVKNSKVTFAVPAKKLATGDYIVKLSALNPQNENESIADYTFRINRK